MISEVNPQNITGKLRTKKEMLKMGYLAAIGGALDAGAHLLHVRARGERPTPPRDYHHRGLRVGL